MSSRDALRQKPLVTAQILLQRRRHGGGWLRNRPSVAGTKERRVRVVQAVLPTCPRCCPVLPCMRCHCAVCHQKGREGGQTWSSNLCMRQPRMRLRACAV
eukprot:362607-Chlamydomonas_euryale.AAC.15